jgi:hypothetical protein
MSPLIELSTKDLNYIIAILGETLYKWEKQYGKEDNGVINLQCLIYNLKMQASNLSAAKLDAK